MHDEELPELGDSVDFGTHEDTAVNATWTHPHTAQPISGEHHTDSLTIKVPPNMVSTRSKALASGSEYTASAHSDDEKPKVEEDEEEAEVEMTRTKRGRVVPNIKYVESSETDGEIDFLPRTRNAARASSKKKSPDDEDEDDIPVRRTTRSKNRQDSGFIASDDDLADAYGTSEPPRRLRRTRSTTASKQPKKSEVPLRRSGRRGQKRDEDGDWNDHSSHASADAEGSSDLDEMQLVPEDIAEINELGNPPDPTPEPEDDKPYALRERKNISYAIPPPLEDMRKPPPKPARGGHRGPKKPRGLGWSASGAELGRWMGEHDSDSDNPTRTPRKGFGGLNPFGASGAIPTGGMLPGDLVSGTPSNLGKIGDAALADADPLGVNFNVSFDEVGGLDEHIHALKEMTLLPLLYPEVFQRFNVTPPRGVLFHGPPGTGKTLLARALAATCRSDGRQISFYMRKGADSLSKWVGEAERQLRLLFEEARNSQPSIIFFDEIDGLAPVRSAKQDQIHASIVSTLLALMDGMDGRGQVIVIGATNRPDAVDPALRRPGRFDREFYFGLPGLDAREKILGIMTKKWANWDVSQEGEKGQKVKETLKGLAKLTKGYGGADLRALCTEAALNAIQRRYPQVYKSNDRLLLKPETIDIGLRDFMISIKKIVPSSARSSTSAATTLPPQFEPLLSDALERVKATIEKVMPIEKKLTALEEAEFEDEGGEDGALEREMLSQSMQTLRIYRPRVIIHGEVGMGQGYIGAAALHHLEGYHVQSLELGSLMSDSARTVEAAIVQLFTEAKRHQPSVLYIPSLVGWCAAVNETTRSTVRAMLETLLPTDPILLLAVVDGPFSSLPKDVKAWFGPSKDNRVALLSPSADQREKFFEPMIKDIQRPPNQFADGMKRRKRILEVLPIAPPLEPRKPTAAELAVQRENDQRTIAVLKYRLQPIIAELKRKYKRFTKRATEEYRFEVDENGIGYPYEAYGVTAGAPPAPSTPTGGTVLDLTEDAMDIQPATVPEHQQQAQEQAMVQLPKMYDMDLDKIYTELYRNHYLTPQSFLEDIGRIVHNAEVFQHEDLDRFHKAQAMYTAAELSIMEFDVLFKLECERMAAREIQRREEDMKDKGKEKEKGKNGNGVIGAPVNGIQTRRSTRQNGNVELLTVTDPVKLERKLKRQRESAANGDGADRQSSGSAEENSGNDSRNAKRSKLLIDEDADDDPMNITSPSPMAAHGQRSVRFDNSLPTILEPSSSFGSVNGVQASPTPLPHYRMQNQQHSVHGQLPYQQQHQPSHLRQTPYQDHQMNRPHLPQQQLPYPQFGQSPSQMGYGAGPSNSTMSQRREGFDASLLNPMSPSEPSRSLELQYPSPVPQHIPQPQFGVNNGPMSPHSPGLQHHSSFSGQPQQYQHQQPQPQFGYPGASPAGNSMYMGGFQPQGQGMPYQQLQQRQLPPQLPHVSVSPPTMVYDPQNPLYTPAPAPVPHQSPLVQEHLHRTHLIPQAHLQIPLQERQQTPLVDSRTPPPPVSKTPDPEPQSVPMEDVRDAVASPESEKELPVLPVATEIADDDKPQQQEQQQGQQQDEQSEAEKQDEPMVVEIERSPTPPLPDFHVDEGLVDELRKKLRVETEGLNVEQLEHLRATCLGDVWRHRKEWDRDELVRGLFKVVDEFLEEVKELQEWEED